MASAPFCRTLTPAPGAGLDGSAGQRFYLCRERGQAPMPSAGSAAGAGPRLVHAARVQKLRLYARELALCLTRVHDGRRSPLPGGRATKQRGVGYRLRAQRWVGKVLFEGSPFDGGCKKHCPRTHVCDTVVARRVSQARWFWQCACM